MTNSEPTQDVTSTSLATWSESGGWGTASAAVAEEIGLTLYLDRVELATLMCTPEKLNFLVAGFLRSEGLIERLDDIAFMRVCDDELVAEVRLLRPREVQGKRILTSGCGGGLAFDEGSSLPPVNSSFSVSPSRVLACMKLLQAAQAGGRRGGTHFSALSDGESLLVVAGDIGRHNTLDKIWGECLFRDIRTSGRMLLTTGRISSEMLVKAAKMEVPVAVSLNSPTDRAVSLGETLGVTVIGYARGSRLSVYTHSKRLMAEEPVA